MRPQILAVTAAALLVVPHHVAAQAAHTNPAPPHHPTAPAQSGPPHSAAATKFGPGPDFLPKAVQFALIQGDPSGSGIYTVRLKFPANFHFPAHFHPVDEHVTVLQGTFIVGMGDSIAVAKGQTLTAGGFITAPANAHHWAVARGITVVQVSGEGPFGITYVKDSDDPRHAAHASGGGN
jgi:quercetin dioxygenase-like cupin family protein